ncbi:hypothetical protein CL638_02315 [bacterium]|jgi:hypothetical protein|nr:hypothetical protein [bacterium]
MNKVQISQHAYKQVGAALFLMILFAVSYLYFLNRSVVHVVMRKEADRSQSELQAEIANLESQYIAAQHKVASQIASLDGYQKEVAKTFVSRTDTDTLVRAN